MPPNPGASHARLPMAIGSSTLVRHSALMRLGRRGTSNASPLSNIRAPRGADGATGRGGRGKPIVRTLLFPEREAPVLDTWKTIGLCGTGSESYRVTDVFVPEAFSAARADPTSRRETGPLYAFTMPGLYAVGVAGVALGIAQAMFEAFLALAGTKAPRGLNRLADKAVGQADVARAEARLAAARAYLVETLEAIHARAEERDPIDVDDRARVRLSCPNAIHGALEVADFA